MILATMIPTHLLARQLKRYGYTVTTATSTQQALRLLKAMPCDLILLDVIMPGMNGLELLEQLKQHKIWRYIPVIDQPRNRWGCEVH